MPGKFFSEFEIGDAFESGGRTVTETDVVNFAGISGDFNPLHIDETFARRTPFERRVAHGMLAVSMSTGQGQTLGIFEGTTLALMGMELNFKAPVFFGDTLRLRLTVESTKPSSKGGKGVVVFKKEILNQDDHIVIEGRWTMLLRDR